MSTKVNKKLIKQVLDEFKEDLFIVITLKRHSINFYDFKKYLETDAQLSTEYKEIESINNEAKEELIAEKSLNGDFSVGIALEFIKANNKEKFNPNKLEITNKFEDLTEDELNEKIKNLNDKINNKK
jgi:hypothetical protein